VKVIENYADNVFEGKWIECKPAVEKGGKGGGKGDKGGDSGGRGVKRPWSEGDSRTIVVDGLPQSSTKEEVSKFFSHFGDIDEVRNTKSLTHVVFSSVEAAKLVLIGYAAERRNPLVFNGATIECKLLEDMPAHVSFAEKDSARAQIPGPTDKFLKVRDMPINPKQRDVFKLFYSYSFARIRECPDETLVEFTSATECKRAFTDKQGARMGTCRVSLYDATQEDMDLALTRLTNPPPVPVVWGMKAGQAPVLRAADAVAGPEELKLAIAAAKPEPSKSSAATEPAAHTFLGVPLGPSASQSGSSWGSYPGAEWGMPEDPATAAAWANVVGMPSDWGGKGGGYASNAGSYGNWGNWT